MPVRPKVLRKGLTVAAWCVAGTAGASASFPSPLVNQERVPPTEDADTKTIVRMIEGGIRSEYALGVRPAMRDAHAKGHGCVRATFTIRGDIPAALRRGVFRTAHIYRAWIRFSNGAGAPHDDAAGDGRGMAVKLTGVPGKKILPGEIDALTQDFLMIDYPVFFIRNVADYVPFTALSLKGQSGQFFATHRREYEITRAITSQKIHAMFDQHYFSMAPYRWGDRYVKYSARPVDCTTGTTIVSPKSAPPAEPNYLRTGMNAWLRLKDACFVFSVQPQTNTAAEPVEDPTILWDERKHLSSTWLRSESRNRHSTVLDNRTFARICPIHPGTPCRSTGRPVELTG